MEISVKRFVGWMERQSLTMLNEDKEMMIEHNEQTLNEEHSEAFKDNRAPKCARCRNHGMVNGLKGHKHFCQWKNCNCERCQVVVERQRITASRVASLRQQRKFNQSSDCNKRVALKFHDNANGDRQLINLDNVKYLNQMKQFRPFENDNGNERADSSGTPASLSPPASPRSSIESCDFERKQKTTASYCTDPSCYECWKISQYMLKTNINKLGVMFPMASTVALEAALSAAKGDYNEAAQTLRYTLRRPPILFRSALPCTDPECKECDSNKDAYGMMRRTPVQAPSPISRKRVYDEVDSPSSPNNFFVKRKPLLVRASSLSPKQWEEKAERNARGFTPPTLIKYCVDCRSQMSVDDKFCGKCGFKQSLKTEERDS